MQILMDLKVMKMLNMINILSHYNKKHNGKPLHDRERVAIGRLLGSLGSLRDFRGSLEAFGGLWESLGFFESLWLSLQSFGVLWGHGCLWVSFRFFEGL